MKTLRIILCVLLLPLTMWYALGVALRNLLYTLGLKRSGTPAVATVGIGNLRMGGTGKTPHTEYLVRLFADRRTALLSRGYGRQTQGFVLAGEGPLSADRLGDEPAMMARKFPSLTVAVCEKRMEGVRRLMEQPQPPQLILLDDVYQHRAIKPAVSILLTEYGAPYSHDHILPFGDLREFRAGRRRADIIVVTKCPATLSQTAQDGFRKQLKVRSRQQLFFSTIDYGTPQPLHGTATAPKADQILLVTGIAHPEPLLAHLREQGTVTHLRFGDHHDFSQADCQRIRDAFEALPGSEKVILTTEKDALRMMAHTTAAYLQGLPIYYLPITVRLLDGDLKGVIEKLLVDRR